MKWIREAMLSEIVAMVGVIVTSLGFLSSLFDENRTFVDLGNVLKPLGVLLFLGGIARSLKKQAETIQTEIADLKPSHQVSTTALAVYDVARGLRTQPNVVCLATNKVLVQIFSKYVPQLAEDLQKFTRDQVSIAVADHSPIHELMYELGTSLRVGGAWFGITLLEHKAAWTTPREDRFAMFKTLMRKRARARELGVLRLYHFGNEDALDAMREEMGSEVESRIQVRYTIGDRLPPDISILWVPSQSGATGFPELGTGKDALDVVSGGGYKGVCALVYETRAGALLTKVTLYSVGTPAFDALSQKFADFWRSGTTFSATEGSGHGSI